MAIPDLFQIQAGKESTWGVGVAPTHKITGISEFNITPLVETMQFPDMRGSLAPAYLSAVAAVGAEGSVEGVCLYEMMPFWLDSLLGESTPTGTYSYVYAAPLSAVPTLRKQTLVKGDGTNDYGLIGAIVNSLTVSGESGAELTYSADLIGSQALVTGTASLSDPTSENVVMGNHVNLYIDDWGGTIGSTLIESTAFAFELEINANRNVKRYLGSLTPGNYRDARFEGTLNITLELNATSKAYLDALLPGTSVFKKLVRINAASGSNLMRFDFAGSSESAPEVFTDRDGVTTLEFSLRGEVDTGDFDNWLKANVVSGLDVDA